MRCVSRAGLKLGHAAAHRGLIASEVIKVFTAFGERS